MGCRVGEQAHGHVALLGVSVLVLLSTACTKGGKNGRAP